MNNYLDKKIRGSATSGLKNNSSLFCVLSLSILLNACATDGGIRNSSGVASVNIDPTVQGPVNGLGIEGHDVISMTDQMVRDMLSYPVLARREKAPGVIIDAEYFINDSSQPINKNSITDRLRVNLNRAAAGRMKFIGRSYSKMVEQERDLKRQGVTDVGTTGLTKAKKGADFRLGGRISSIDSRSSISGLQQRYTQITFEMIDLENSEIVWSGIYEFARAAADDVVYR